MPERPPVTTRGKQTSVWRIDRARFRGDILSGEGARRYGGRWNPVGVPAIYTSQSRALAALEVLVHLSAIDTPKIVHDISEIEFPSRLTEWPAIERLNLDLLDERQTQEFGRQWVEGNRSLVLAVPSLLIREEFNFIINPRHRYFHRVAVSRQRPFVFDPRLK